MPISGAEPLLRVAGLTAGYGKLRVLHGVDITVGRGELVAILGPNGAGKSTLLCTIAGLLPKQAGRVVFDGRDLAGLGAKDTVRLGIAHVIQDHRIFTHLSVQDNLLLAGYDLPRASAPGAYRGSLCAVPRDCRQAEPARRRALRRAAADAGGGAGGGAPAQAADARRAFRRPVARAGRSCAGGGWRLASRRHFGPAGRASRCRSR